MLKTLLFAALLILPMLALAKFASNAVNTTEHDVANSKTYSNCNFANLRSSDQFPQSCINERNWIHYGGKFCPKAYTPEHLDCMVTFRSEGFQVEASCGGSSTTSRELCRAWDVITPRGVRR